MPALSRLATLAVVALVPTAVSLVLPLPGPTAVPKPVKPDVAKHRLAAGTSIPADARTVSATDLAEAAKRAGGVTPVVTAASAPVTLGHEVNVVGVTWQPGSARGVSVQYRSNEGGSWGPWEFVDADLQHRPDGAELRRPSVREGSDPLVVTHADEVQLRVLGPARSGPPVDPELVVVDPGQSPADGLVVQQPAGAAMAVARRPYIYSRAQWGADESLRDPAGPSYGAVRAAFVHHTAGTNAYTSDEVPAIIRGIYAYHVTGNGWSDIGYNFLVDRFGRTWEGRYGGTTRPVIGAHAYGVNSYTFGVSVLGNFQTEAPPAAVISAVSQLAAWKAQIHEFNPGGKAKIGGVTYNAISGHRDAFNNSTECPGIYLYNQLPAIRSSAAAQVRGLPSLSLDRDLDNHNDADVVATNTNHDLLLYSTTNARTVTGPATLVSGGWADRDEVHIVGDWNGDGAVDLVARVPATGALELYAGKGDGTIDVAKQIGAGWSSITAIIAPGDWNGDGRPDLLARMADATLRIYPGNGTGGFLRPYGIGVGWGGMRVISGVGDWDGDGAPDLLTVDGNGGARIYRGNGKGGFNGYIALPGDWSGRDKIVGVGDASWDTRVDVFSVSADGQAEMGIRGATPTDITWVPVDAPFAGVEVYSG